MQAIYCRVSTEDQAKTGYSLPDQIASCKALPHKLGKTDKRKAINCKTGIDNLQLFKISTPSKDMLAIRI